MWPTEWRSRGRSGWSAAGPARWSATLRDKWPKRSRRAVVLRVGCNAVERWARDLRGWSCEASAEMTAEGDRVASLALAADMALRLGAESAVGRVIAVLESAWLPVMLVPLGPELWSRSHAEQLLRHRLGEIYGLDEQREVRMDFRAGEGQALGYGLSLPFKQALQAAAVDAGAELASLQPALSWGCGVMRQRGDWSDAGQEGWWVWREQDRSLVARLHRGRLTSLNAGAPVMASLDEAKQYVARESLRLGVLPLEAPSVVLAGWPSVEVADELGEPGEPGDGGGS